MELARWDCPICQTVDAQHRDDILEAADRIGAEWSFAPVPESRERSARERIYYASREIAEGMEDEVRQALFSAARRDQETDSWDRAANWLGMAIPRVYWHEFTRDVAQQERHMNSVDKAIRMVVEVGNQHFPAWVLIDDNGIRGIAGGGEDPQARVDNLMQTLEEIAE